MAGQVFDLQTVQKKTPADALAELKKQGINSLDDLVNKSLTQLRKAPTAQTDVKSSTFVYAHFINTTIEY